MDKISLKKSKARQPRNSVRKKVASSARVVATKSAAVKSEVAVPVYEVHRAAPTAFGEQEVGLWGRAVTQWQLGDWQGLAEIDLSTLDQDTARAQLAALAACAHLQLGDKTEARRCLAAANRWKCPPQFLVRALAAGVETTMARYHARCGREDKEMQFLSASAGAFGGDASLAARARKALSAQSANPAPTNSITNEQLLPPEPTSASVLENDVPLTLEQAIEKAKAEPSPFKQGITSYAQNFEDVMLWRALGHIENGFYIDVGAFDPSVDSVGKAFYDHGWSGIEVEPLSQFASRLKAARPRNKVVQACVSSTPKQAAYYELKGLSTTSSVVAAHHRAQGHAIVETTMPSITLDDVLSGAAGRPVHWMKIDVEGAEADVLQSWKFHPARPWIVVVESTLPDTQITTHGLWETLLVSKGYMIAYFDGLNRFYVHERHANLANLFSLPPNFFDRYHLNQSHEY